MMRARSGKGRATNILRVAIVLLFLGLAIWAITLNRYGLVIADHEPWLWLTVALVSVGPELAGIVIGIVTIDYLNERRQDELIKEQLVLQMVSKFPDVVDAAFRTVKARRWLYDGSLSGANLRETNLSGADLTGANLSQANLRGANLSKIYFWKANLSQANLRGANLRGANLWDADLSGADLGEADLNGASLPGANLSGASLPGANLNGADLGEADLNGASLPGANLSGADLRRANLSGARLARADLSGAYLWETNLSGAHLEGADLSGLKLWTIEQLEQAITLEGAIMPDKTQLRWERAEWWNDRIEGPTFDEWKAQCLAEYGGAESDIRGTYSEPDDATDGQAEDGR